MMDQGHIICKLIKSLYVLKQAPHVWYENLTRNLLKINFKLFNIDDETLIVKEVRNIVVYIVRYVDVLLITKDSGAYITSKKRIEEGF